MNDTRTLLIAIFVDIVHIKLFCQQSIPLNGDHSIFFAVYIFGIDIHLWSIECGFSHILHKWDIQFL